MKLGMAGSGLAVGAGLGAVTAYFLDPDRGRGRRAETADRLAGLVRQIARRAGRGFRYIRGTAGGLRERLANQPSTPDGWMNDETLAHKVESVLFRDPTIPKGSMNINVEHGTVVLRGTADSADQIERITAATMAIDGVLTVRNLMRAPSDAPAEAAVQRS